MSTGSMDEVMCSSALDFLDVIEDFNFHLGLAIGAGVVIILWILCLLIFCCSCLLYRMKKNRTYHIKEMKSSAEDMDLGFQSIIPIDPEGPNDMEKITNFGDDGDNVKISQDSKIDESAKQQDKDGLKSGELVTVTIPSIPSGMPKEDNGKVAINPAAGAPDKESKCVKFDIPKVIVESTSDTPVSIPAPSLASNAEIKTEPTTVNSTTPQLLPELQIQNIAGQKADSEISNEPKSEAGSDKKSSPVDKPPTQQDDVKKDTVVPIESLSATVPLPEAPLVVSEKKNDSLENMFKDILEFSASQSLNTEVASIEL